MSHSYISRQQRKTEENMVPERSNLIKVTMGICIRYLLPAVAVAAGVLITLHLLKTGPQAKPMAKKKSGVAVETIEVRFDSYPTKISAMGVVKAARYTALKPQVSGQVVELGEHLIPGGRFNQGDTLLKLDPSDYELILKQQENAVVQAGNDLFLEEGNQLVVKREFALMGEEVSEAEKKLMLRQPQLSTLQTALTIAQAKKEQAELNLQRTIITAPFNGIVQTREVNIGTWVSTSSTLATLVGSDRYWVEVSVPEEQLQWITLPAGTGVQGSRVKVYNPTAWSDDIYREGKVIQLLPGLETQGRMARLLIEVGDPLALEQSNAGKPQLLIDSFVRVVIEGKIVPEAVKMSREYLRNGNKLWVYTGEGNLAIRDVSIGFKNRDSVLITSGVKPGDEVITSNISTPVEGLSLRRMGEGNRRGTGKRPNVLAMNSAGKGKGKEADDE